MTVHVLGTLPAEKGQVYKLHPVLPYLGKTWVNTEVPPTEWKRPCDTCDGDGITYDDDGGSFDCHPCDNSGTITVPLTCQNCDGKGTVMLRRFNGGNGGTFASDCSDCRNGHPIIEHRIYGEDSMGYHFRTVRLTIEAVPIVRPQHQRTEELVIKRMADGAFLCQSGERTRISLTEGKPGMYVIIGRGTDG